ncbi:MAG: metallophosphoesterase [Planctomycetaceae bacterium]
MANNVSRIVFVQISDLHFGDAINRHSAEWIPGCQSHHVDLAIALKTTLRRMKSIFGLEATEKLHLLVSGDLTSRGQGDEFHVAHTYLLSEFVLDRNAMGSLGSETVALPPDVTLTPGLRWPPSQLLTIPGNHDHWNGNPGVFPPAFNPDVSPQHVPTSPWRKRLVSRDENLSLDLYGIDSNRGWVNEMFDSNQFAGGQIHPDDLDWIEREHEKHSDADLRCLLSHHGVSDRAVRSRFRLLPEAKTLLGPSKVAVASLCRNCKVHVILTGHLHQHLVEPISPGHNCYEVRCFSTLQGEPDQNSPQGFLVHVVTKDRFDEITWEVHPFVVVQKTHRAGFEISNPPEFMTTLKFPSNQ